MKKEFIVNPWEVSGNVDYVRVVKELWLRAFEAKSLPRTFQDEILFRRRIIFVHRDFNGNGKANHYVECNGGTI